MARAGSEIPPPIRTSEEGDRRGSDILSSESLPSGPQSMRSGASGALDTADSAGSTSQVAFLPSTSEPASPKGGGRSPQPARKTVVNSPLSADGHYPAAPAVTVNVEDALNGALSAPRKKIPPSSPTNSAPGRGVAGRGAGRGAAGRGGAGRGAAGRGAAGLGDPFRLRHVKMDDSLAKPLTAELVALLKAEGGRLMLPEVSAAYTRMYGHSMRLEGFKLRFVVEEEQLEGIYFHPRDYPGQSEIRLTRYRPRYTTPMRVKDEPPAIRKDDHPYLIGKSPRENLTRTIVNQKALHESPPPFNNSRAYSSERSGGVGGSRVGGYSDRRSGDGWNGAVSSGRTNALDVPLPPSSYRGNFSATNSITTGAAYNTGDRWNREFPPPDAGVSRVRDSRVSGEERHDGRRRSLSRSKSRSRNRARGGGSGGRSSGKPLLTGSREPSRHSSLGGDRKERGRGDQRDEYSHGGRRSRSPDRHPSRTNTRRTGNSVGRDRKPLSSRYEDRSNDRHQGGRHGHGQLRPSSPVRHTRDFAPSPARKRDDFDARRSGAKYGTLGGHSRKDQQPTADARGSRPNADSHQPPADARGARGNADRSCSRDKRAIKGGGGREQDKPLSSAPKTRNKRSLPDADVSRDNPNLTLRREKIDDGVTFDNRRDGGHGQQGDSPPRKRYAADGAGVGRGGTEGGTYRERDNNLAEGSRANNGRGGGEEGAPPPSAGPATAAGPLPDMLPKAAGTHKVMQQDAPGGRIKGARLMIKGTHPAVPERRIHALVSDFGVVGKIEVLEGFVLVHMRSPEEAARAELGLNTKVEPHVSGGHEPLLASVWNEQMYQLLMARESMRRYADSMRKASTWYEKNKNVDFQGPNPMLCRFFALGRGCIFGRNCVFAHGPAPADPPPPPAHALNNVGPAVTRVPPRLVGGPANAPGTAMSGSDDLLYQQRPLLDHTPRDYRGQPPGRYPHGDGFTERRRGGTMGHDFRGAIVDCGSDRAGERDIDRVVDREGGRVEDDMLRRGVGGAGGGGGYGRSGSGGGGGGDGNRSNSRSWQPAPRAKGGARVSPYSDTGSDKNDLSMEKDRPAPRMESRGWYPAEPSDDVGDSRRQDKSPENRGFVPGGAKRAGQRRSESVGSRRGRREGANRTEQQRSESVGSRRGRREGARSRDHRDRSRSQEHHTGGKVPSRAKNGERRDSGDSYTANHSFGKTSNSRRSGSPNASWNIPSPRRHSIGRARDVHRHNNNSSDVIGSEEKHGSSPRKRNGREQEHRSSRPDKRGLRLPGDSKDVLRDADNRVRHDGQRTRPSDSENESDYDARHKTSSRGGGSRRGMRKRDKHEANGNSISDEEGSSSFSRKASGKRGDGGDRRTRQRYSMEKRARDSSLDTGERNKTKSYGPRVPASDNSRSSRGVDRDISSEAPARRKGRDFEYVQEVSTGGHVARGKKKPMAAPHTTFTVTARMGDVEPQPLATAAAVPTRFSITMPPNLNRALAGSPRFDAGGEQREEQGRHGDGDDRGRLARGGRGGGAGRERYAQPHVPRGFPKKSAWE